MAGSNPPQNKTNVNNGIYNIIKNNVNYEFNNISNQNYTTVIRGAHYSPFSYPSSTTSQFDIPSYLLERNQGLVLDRKTLKKQLHFQSALVSDLHGEIQFMNDNKETAIMDATLRSRKDVYRVVRTLHCTICCTYSFNTFSH